MPDSSIIPVLSYENVAEAIDWLCSTFGFTERWRVGTHRAQLSFGNGTIVVAEQGQNKSKQSLLVRVADVEKHYMHAKASHAKIVQVPQEFPYGEKQYTVEDIGGHIWNFSESIQDVAPESFGGVSRQL